MRNLVFKSVAILRDTFCQLVNHDSLAHTLRYLNLNDWCMFISLLTHLMLNPLYSTIYQVLILRYWLLLQPYIQLILYKLHLQIDITRYPLVIPQHTLRFQQCRNTFAPAQLQAHTKQVFLSQVLLRQIGTFIRGKLDESAIAPPASLLFVPRQHELDRLHLAELVEDFGEHGLGHVGVEVAYVEVRDD